MYAEPAGQLALFAAVAASKGLAWQTITDRLGRRRGFADGAPQLPGDRNVVASERLWDRLRITSAITQGVNGTDGRRFTTNIERCVPSPHENTDPFGRRMRYSRDTLDRWIRDWRRPRGWQEASSLS